MPPVAALRELSSRTKGSNTRDAVILGNAGAFILDHDVIAVAAGGDLDIGLVAIGDGVLDQIAHGAADLVGPADRRAPGAWFCQVTGSPRSSRSAQRLSTSADRSTLRLASPPAPRAADSTCSVSSCNSSRFCCRPSRNSSSSHEFQIDAHGGDGRAQIMAHGGEKMALAFQGARDLVGHLVEGDGGVAHIVGTFFLDMGSAAAARHHRGGGGEFGERPRHPARHQGGRGGRHQDRHHGGDDDFHRPGAAGVRRNTADNLL